MYERVKVFLRRNPREPVIIVGVVGVLVVGVTNPTTKKFIIIQIIFFS